jgi:hypothetical protein
VSEKFLKVSGLSLSELIDRAKHALSFFLSSRSLFLSFRAIILEENVFRCADIVILPGDSKQGDFLPSDWFANNTVYDASLLIEEGCYSWDPNRRKFPASHPPTKLRKYLDVPNFMGYF